MIDRMIKSMKHIQSLAIAHNTITLQDDLDVEYKVKGAVVAEYKLVKGTEVLNVDNNTLAKILYTMELIDKMYLKDRKKVYSAMNNFFNGCILNKN